MTEVGSISESLEDYLKIIFQLERERRVARVKDIAARKGVRMASVTGALRRMSKEGLVNYGAREFVELTDDGANLARKILQRSDFLRRFLTLTLGLEVNTAEKDACAIEHHISSESLGRLVALFQFMQNYGHHEQLSKFLDDGVSIPCPHCPNSEGEKFVDLTSLQRLAELEPGTTAKIAWIDGDSQHRLDLVEKGLLPRVHVTMEAHHNGAIRVRIKDTPVRLSEAEAEAVRLWPEAEASEPQEAAG